MEDKILKDAQYRKNLSIAYFNSLNSAIEVLKTIYGSHLDGVGYENIKKEIADWRDHFLEEHKEYHARVIAKVGTNYDLQEAIAKIESTKSLAELKKAWLLLSEDERRDEEIIKVKNMMKKKHEKA